MAPQPFSGISTIVYTPSISALVISAAPGRSAPLSRPMPSSAWISRAPATAAKTPIGRFTKKIQCQLIASVSTPPSSSPSEAPAAATKL